MLLARTLSAGSRELLPLGLRMSTPVNTFGTAISTIVANAFPELQNFLASAFARPKTHHPSPPSLHPLLTPRAPRPSPLLAYRCLSHIFDPATVHSRCSGHSPAFPEPSLAHQESRRVRWCSSDLRIRSLSSAWRVGRHCCRVSIRLPRPSLRLWVPRAGMS